MVLRLPKKGASVFAQVLQPDYVYLLLLSLPEISLNNCQVY